MSCFMRTCGRKWSYIVNHENHGRIRVCLRHSQIMINESEVATRAEGSR